MRQQPPGKAVPAFGLLTVGLLMTWSTLTRWHRSRLDPSGHRFRNSLRFNSRKFPWDYVFVGVLSLIGLMSMRISSHFSPTDVVRSVVLAVELAHFLRRSIFPPWNGFDVDRTRRKLSRSPAGRCRRDREGVQMGVDSAEFGLRQLHPRCVPSVHPRGVFGIFDPPGG